MHTEVWEALIYNTLGWYLSFSILQRRFTVKGANMPESLIIPRLSSFPLFLARYVLFILYIYRERDKPGRWESCTCPHFLLGISLMALT